MCYLLKIDSANYQVKSFKINKSYNQVKELVKRLREKDTYISIDEQNEYFGYSRDYKNEGFVLTKTKKEMEYYKELFLNSMIEELRDFQ